MKKFPGNTLDNFSWPRVGGGDISFKELHGKPIWIAFYRFAACPLCNLRIHEIIQSYGRWESSGLHKIAVFQSDHGKMDEVHRLHTPPFDLVADPEKKLYQEFGLERSIFAPLNPKVIPRLIRGKSKTPKVKRDGDSTQLPGDFLIDRGGTIHTAYYGKHMADHISFEAIDVFIEASSGNNSPGS